MANPPVTIRVGSRRWPRFRHRPRDLALAAIVVLVGIPLVAVGFAAAAFLLFPPPVTLPQPQAATFARTSHIYAADGSLLASLHAQYNREPVALDQMATSLQQAAVASEDARFYQHAGIDVTSILRALLADVRAKTAVQGGSTITEQYVKNAYTGNQRSLFRKFREALVAAQVERTYSKSKILESYLNTVYFGEGAYGAEAAAQTYFNKHASQLTLSESAELVGVIPAPDPYSPIAHPQQAEARRLVVLDRMRASGAITDTELAAARAAKPALATSKVDVTRFPWFVDAVQRYLSQHYGDKAVFSGGLDVTTTVDPAMQTQAEKVLATTLNKPDDPYGSLVSVDPRTGYVTAIVGGRDYNAEKFNIAIQGRRQPGSSFKPFVLVAALESGVTPGTTFAGPSTICLPAWKPDCHVSNFDNENFGPISIETATIHSVNTVFAQLVLQVGPDRAVDAARRMGIPGPTWLPGRSGCKVTATDPCRTLLEPLPSIALGSEEVTPLEMASAYATLAAWGVYRQPKVVSRVTDGTGQVLESGPSDPVQALSPGVAFTATTLLQEVITQGTGTGAGIGRPAAGKTGTATDFRNAWFVGYTPDLATAVWMGYRDANTAMRGIHGVAQVTGGSLPASMWSAYMKAVLAGVPPSPFAPPEGQQAGAGFQLPVLPTPWSTPTVTPAVTATVSPAVTATVTASPTPTVSATKPTPKPNPPKSPTPTPSPSESPTPTPKPSKSPRDHNHEGVP
ncbi:MAG TPA: PBP1A family penicillin-binding protein [Actinomycetota bacterium]|nr:PBP1A family penicillin-binding protein [Actinomycetota bacterium]